MAGRHVHRGLVDVERLLRPVSRRALPPAHPSELLAACGRRAAAFERRRQLLAMREGRQRGPVPAGILGRGGRGNLNPGYWTGAAGVAGP
jgi:hypothetical protein